MIKFQKKYSDVKYLLSFDLAKHVTGFSVCDYANKNIAYSGVIKMEDNVDNFWFNYYKTMLYIVENVKSMFPHGLVVVKEKLPAQAGKFTTIASLQALAMAHAALDIACGLAGVEMYDHDGVHSRSVKAYFAKITGI